MPLRVGVVGVGYLGKEHARVYHELAAAGGCILAGVADTDRRRAEEVARRLGVPAFPSHRDLLGRIDAASVAVPTTGHHAVARELLEAGVPVLVEKPIARTVEEAEDLVRTAASRRLALQVGHIERFNPAFAGFLKNGRPVPDYLETHRLAPYKFRSSDIGVVLDLMIHDLDLVLHLVGSPVEAVEAVGVEVLTGREDMASARLLFANGAVASLNANRVAFRTLRRLRFFTREAYVTLDLGAREALVIRKSAKVDWSRFSPDRPDPSPAAQNRRLFDLERIRFPSHEPLKAECAAFLDAIASGSPPLVTGQDGLEALRLALRIRASLNERLRRMGRPPVAD